jgi:hypothetical protein
MRSHFTRSFDQLHQNLKGKLQMATNSLTALITGAFQAQPRARRNPRRRRKRKIMNDVCESTEKAIVLVHGGFVDGSGWEEVYYILKKDGYE